MASRFSPAAAAVMILVTITGCESAGDGFLFRLSGTGNLDGQVFLDLDRTGVRSPGDPPVRGIPVAQVMRGTRDTLGLAVADTSGRFTRSELPAGTYLMVPDEVFMGDSLQVTGVEPNEVSVFPNRTTSVSVGLSFPERTVPEILSSPTGRRLFTRGVALNSFGALSGGALHVRAEGRAVRVIGIPSLAASAGDTVLVLGRTQMASGRVILAQGSGRRLAEGPGDVPAVAVSSSTAASADGGTLDADLVRIEGATVVERTTAFGEVQAIVTDGSGPVTLRFPASFLFDLRLDSLAVGTVLGSRGVLLPTAGGAPWEIRPRSAADLVIPGATPPEPSIGFPP